MACCADLTPVSSNLKSQTWLVKAIKTLREIEQYLEEYEAEETTEVFNGLEKKISPNTVNAKVVEETAGESLIIDGMAIDQMMEIDASKSLKNFHTAPGESVSFH